MSPEQIELDASLSIRRHAGDQGAQAEPSVNARTQFREDAPHES